MYFYFNTLKSYSIILNKCLNISFIQGYQSIWETPIYRRTMIQLKPDQIQQQQRRKLDKQYKLPTTCVLCQFHIQ